MISQAEPRTRKLRALVVEDEKIARNYLIEMLHASGRIGVVAAVATLHEARQALTSGGVVVDVAFVDIRLSGSESEAGLDLVRSLVGTPGAPLFVLATALPQHAVEAYDLGVVDYLLKPFHQDRVFECVARLDERIPHTSPLQVPERVVARSRKGLVFFSLDEVWAFEARGRLVFVHTARGCFDVDLSLTAVEISFGSTVVRVHRQWIVNAAHVRAMETEDGETVVKVGDDSLVAPVSRARRSAVRDLLIHGAAGIR